MSGFQIFCGMRRQCDEGSFKRFTSYFAPATSESSRGERAGKPSEPIPVEPDGGIGDGAGPLPEATTLAIGEEDGGGSTPPPGTVTTQALGEEDGGGGIGVFPPPEVTTLAIGEEDGGAPVNEIIGGSADEFLRGTRGPDRIVTGGGNDVVCARGGDDRIVVSGEGNTRIIGGKGTDTVELKGARSDYVAEIRGSRVVITGPNGAETVLRQVESVFFAGSGETVLIDDITDPAPPVFPDGFVAFYSLAPNSLGATNLNVSGGTAELTGPGTNFVFTGVDASPIAADGPIIATAGSGTINGVETTAAQLSPFGDAVLTIGSGFGGTQPVNATFANGAVLSAEVEAVAVP